MVGGQRPLSPKICAQSDPPPLKCADFDQYLLITSQPEELAKKVQLWRIGSRPRAFQRAIDEVRTLLRRLPLTPQRVSQITNLSFRNRFPYISVIDEASDFKFDLQLRFA